MALPIFKDAKGTKPPPAPTVPAASNNAIAQDPYNLSLQGYGDLANQVIQGSNEFFGLPTTMPGPTTTKNSQRLVLTNPVAPLTATQTIQAFVHLAGAKLAQVQDQLYRAGYYSANYVPKYGLLNAEDISAFRTMMIGLASNPSQATLPDYLNQSAQAGDSHGLGRRSPLVVKLTNPDDLRVTLQKTVQDLYGGNMSEGDVQNFISTFQSQQAQEQTSAYSAGGFNPETGQADLTGTPSAGGTVTAVASPTAAAETYARTKYPNQVAATQFGNALGGILATLKNPAV